MAADRVRRRARRPALLVWLVALGCGPESDGAADDELAGRCIADPVAHLVDVDACETDADCPLGTICGSPPSSDLTFVCTPPQGPAAPSNALTEGFGVSQMTATLTTVVLPSNDGTERAGAELAWRAPSGAKVVTCVLLACPPVIEGGQIINYDQCVLARDVSEQAQGAFSLTAADAEQPLAGRTGECEVEDEARDSTDGRFPVTELLVGCWAYDEARMVAATRLARPSATDVFDFHDNFDLDCGGMGAEGRACVLEDGILGTCVAGDCRRRCLRDADCGTDRAPARAGTCELDVRFGELSVCGDRGPARGDSQLPVGFDPGLVVEAEVP